MWPSGQGGGLEMLWGVPVQVWILPTMEASTLPRSFRHHCQMGMCCWSDELNPNMCGTWFKWMSAVAGNIYLALGIHVQSSFWLVWRSYWHRYIHSQLVTWHSSIPWPGIEPGPRRWERRILATRPPGSCYPTPGGNKSGSNFSLDLKIPWFYTNRQTHNVTHSDFSSDRKPCMRVGHVKSILVLIEKMLPCAQIYGSPTQYNFHWYFHTYKLLLFSYSQEPV